MSGVTVNKGEPPKFVEVPRLREASNPPSSPTVTLPKGSSAFEIYANIWQTDKLARIDPISGKVLGWIDLSGLLPPESSQTRVDVLNGIAYDDKTDRLFVTGKWWPLLFEIALIDVN